MRVSGLGIQTPQKTNFKNSKMSHAPTSMQMSSPLSKSRGEIQSLSASKIDLVPLKKNQAIGTITFGSNAGSGKKIFLGAEFRYDKVGGVATVMNDYANRFPDDAIVIPYYNGDIALNQNGEINGKPEGRETIQVLKKKVQRNGQEVEIPVYTKTDLTKTKLEDVENSIDHENKKITENYHELETIAEKNMQWGKNEQEKIALYKVKDKQVFKDGQLVTVPNNHYMIFSTGTAGMPKPYKDNGYAYSPGGKKISSSKAGDPYAKFNKAFVEFLPELEEKGIKAEHILLSDAQSAFVPEYIEAKILEGGDKSEFYKGLKASYIMHNIGPGYQGETSNETMFYNFASKKQIEAIEQDSHYIEALKNNKTEEYFTQFIKETLDNKPESSANATMIPIRYAQKGAMNIDTVSEDYAISAASNPKVALGLTEHLKEGMADDLAKLLPNYRKEDVKTDIHKWFGGILNPFSDPGFNPSKPIPGGLTYYSGEHTDEATGITHKPFETFEKDAPLDEIVRKKQKNAQNMFQRLAKGANPDYADGRKNNNTKLIGHIDKKWADMAGEFAETGNPAKKVTVFTTWGRGDFQKGIDTVLNSYIEHVKKDLKEGKENNSVLILGGEHNPKQKEAKTILDKVELATKDADLKGRIAFMNGFAPNQPLAMCADSCVFASRFAPCELTDFEAMLKAGSSPIVTGTQGLNQKNFDKRNPNEADRATGYKTQHEYFMSDKELETTSTEYKAKYNKMVTKEVDSLKARGVQPQIAVPATENHPAKTITIRELAEKNVKKTDDFKDLYRKYADKVLVKEFAEAMDIKAKQFKEEPQQYEKELRNSLNMKTGWDDNHNLHPSGKSTFEMYQDRHFGSQKDFKNVTKRLFDFSEAKLREIQDRAINLLTNAKKTGEQFLENSAENNSSSGGGKTGKIIGIVAASVAVVGGGIYAAMKSKKNKQNKQQYGQQFGAPQQYNYNSQPSQRRSYAPTYRGRTA